jgi:hypothetical protein
VSTITAASSLADIRAVYLDNVSYAEDASVTKAKAFITACKALMLTLAERQVHGGRGGGQEIQFNLEMIANEKKTAESWLAGADDTGGSGGGIVHVDFGRFRD